MTLHELNILPKEQLKQELFKCCGSENWVNKMLPFFPADDMVELINDAEDQWYECTEADWLEAFTHHPKIGDTKSLTEKFAGKEQAGVAAASAEIIEVLANANAAYEKKFGFIFIVCATGRSVAEMLRLLNDRLTNSREEELNIAMGEQHKITLIRFNKLFSGSHFKFLSMSQITTHVLDTSVGKPAKDMTIQLMHKVNDNWQTMAQGVTNADGRIGDLLPPGKKLSQGIYKLVFDTGNYFSTNNIKGFYPEVEIQFTINDDAQYHVPLLINHYGYSTYRGS